MQGQTANSSIGAAMPVDGSDFVFLHGRTIGFPGAAIGRSEVTRQQYSEFVNATHRAPSDCAKTDRNGNASQKNWSNPGFPQNSDHPVVCISWADALAYTQWLGQRDGHRYRLPTRAEWRLATLAGTSSTVTGNGTAAAASGTPNALGLTGLDGNVGQWLIDCTDACRKHVVAGRSWRNRGGDGPVPREGDRGFDDIGFRVIRVLGEHNAAGAQADAPAASPTEPAANSIEQRPNLRTIFGRRHRKN
jgi:formylglycine-generating enzyme required for sulfatase activity